MRGPGPGGGDRWKHVGSPLEITGSPLPLCDPEQGNAVCERHGDYNASRHQKAFPDSVISSHFLSRRALDCRGAVLTFSGTGDPSARKDTRAKCPQGSLELCVQVQLSKCPGNGRQTSLSLEAPEPECGGVLWVGGPRAQGPAPDAEALSGPPGTASGKPRLAASAGSSRRSRRPHASRAVPLWSGPARWNWISARLLVMSPPSPAACAAGGAQMKGQ